MWLFVWKQKIQKKSLDLIFLDRLTIPHTAPCSLAIFSTIAIAARCHEGVVLKEISQRAVHSLE